MDVRVRLWRRLNTELWCWRRLLRVPWTARRSNQSILKEINPGISLVGMMLKLKLQYFGHLLQRADSLEKTLMLGEIGGRRKKGRQRMRWLDGITDGCEFEWTLGVGDGQGGMMCCSSWGRKRMNSTEGLNWTEWNISHKQEHISVGWNEVGKPKACYIEWSQKEKNKYCILVHIYPFLPEPPFPPAIPHL